MKYYSTNKEAPLASLKKAVMKGLAGDNGLYMPENIDLLKDFVVGEMKDMTFREIACIVAQALFGDDVDGDTIEHIVGDTLNFDAPAVPLHDNIYCLELFHGPTLAIKDVGARFMARLLDYFIEREGVTEVNVLVATSGDTGSAVANGFLGMEGIRVFVLYPKGKVSPIQECQFATLGSNITALEVDGSFDDCQALVKALHGRRHQETNQTDVGKFHQRRPLPAPVLLLFLCLRPIGQGRQSRRIGGKRPQRQLRQP